jgi:tRNA A58 N-methylase Trm61
MVCPHWLSGILYNPLRKAFTDRLAVLRESGIRESSVVLEVGAGNGFFTEVLAGRARFVYAVELQEQMAQKLRKRLGGNPGSRKVKIMTGDIAAIDLADGTVDAGFLYYAFHEMDDPEGAAERIARAIKPKGVLAIYEPTVEVSRRMMERTVALFERQGMKREERRDRFFTRFALLRKK